MLPALAFSLFLALVATSTRTGSRLVAFGEDHIPSVVTSGQSRGIADERSAGRIASHCSHRQNSSCQNIVAHTALSCRNPSCTSRRQRASHVNRSRVRFFFTLP